MPLAASALVNNYGIPLYSTLTTYYIPHFLLALFALLFLHHIVLLRPSTTQSPPLIRGPLPFIGCALSFLRNPEPFLLKSQSVHGPLFTLYIAGKRLHVITDPIIGIPTVYRNYRQFPFAVLANHVDIELFGVREAHAKDTKLYKANLDRLAPNLLKMEKVEELLAVFNDCLIPVLERRVHSHGWDAEIHNKGTVATEGNETVADNQSVLEVDLCNFVRRLMFECSGKALFGPTWPEDDDFYESFCQWDKGTFDILKGYPKLFTRNAIMGRERYYERLLDMYEKGLRGASQLVRERIEVEAQHGYALHDAVRNTIGITFALFTNAVPASFWMIAYITALPTEEKNLILEEIKTHVLPESTNRPLQDKDQPKSGFKGVKFNTATLLRSPLLNSALSETLRIQFRGLSIRGVEQDTYLTVNVPKSLPSVITSVTSTPPAPTVTKSYFLPANSTLFLSTSCIHKNPAIYDSPFEYRVHRFEKMWRDKFDDIEPPEKGWFFMDGGVVKYPLMPWGGGHFMCTGRKFATGEIILLAATILHLFDIAPLDQPFPSEAPVSRFGGGVEFPAKEWRVRMKFRQ